MDELYLPPSIRLETERFVLRSLSPEDASERWARWSGDVETMAMLNLPPRAGTVEDLRRYIGSFDGRHRVLLGIFAKADGAHVGIYTARLDHDHHTVTYNLLVGEREWRRRHVHSETRVALNDFFFEVVGVEKAAATVRADNHPVVFNLLRGGWTLEGHLRRHARSPDDGRRVDLYQFGLLREDWHAWKRGRSEVHRG